MLYTFVFGCVFPEPRGLSHHFRCVRKSRFQIPSSKRVRNIKLSKVAADSCGHWVWVLVFRALRLRGFGLRIFQGQERHAPSDRQLSRNHSGNGFPSVLCLLRRLTLLGRINFFTLAPCTSQPLCPYEVRGILTRWSMTALHFYSRKQGPWTHDFQSRSGFDCC